MLAVEEVRMHAQARSDTSASPPNLETFLEALNPPAEQDRINLEGVSGCGIEGDGNFAFTVENGREELTHSRLAGDAHYEVLWTTDLYAEPIDTATEPGVLLQIIQNAKAAHPGRAIDSVLVGVDTEDGGFFAQVTFLDSTWTTDPPGSHP
jgi:hypothetical protein